MLKILSNYLQYSGIWIALCVNPCQWSFKFEFMHPDDLNPKMRGVYLVLAMVSIRIVIDDGSW